MKKLIDYFDISGDCLFSVFPFPVWAYAFPDKTELDGYFLLNYGGRNAFETLLDRYADSTGKITGNDLSSLAAMIYHINARKWERLFKVYNADYSPTENTDVFEDVTEKTNANGEVVTDSDTTYTAGTKVTNKRAGFNSSSVVADSESANSGEDSTALDNTVTSESDRTTERTYRKHGNIGVMENTTMLQHEVEFWKWSFMDAVCKDICDTIALSIY